MVAMVQLRNRSKAASLQAEEPRAPLKATSGNSRRTKKQSATPRERTRFVSPNFDVHWSNQIRFRKGAATISKRGRSVTGEAKTQIRHEIQDILTFIENHRPSTTSDKRDLTKTLASPSPELFENVTFTKAKEAIQTMRSIIDSYTAANKDPIYVGSKPEFRWEQDGQDLGSLNHRLREAVEKKIGNYILPQMDGKDFQNTQVSTKDLDELDKLAQQMVRAIGPGDNERTWGSSAYETLQGLASVNKAMNDD